MVPCLTAVNENAPGLSLNFLYEYVVNHPGIIKTSGTESIFSILSMIPFLRESLQNNTTRMNIYQFTIDFHK